MVQFSKSCHFKTVSCKRPLKSHIWSIAPTIYTDLYLFYETLNHIPPLILCPFPNSLPKHLQCSTHCAAGRCQGAIPEGWSKANRTQREISELCFCDPRTLVLWWSGTKRTEMAFLFLSSASSSHSSLYTWFFSCSFTTTHPVRVTP